MADSAQLIKHIESYVDSSTSPSQQEVNIDAIAALLKNNMLTMEKLVRDMEMYLTTTDSTIRTRGILLLAELLTRLTSKPLDDASVCSMIGFFSERLADWKALRGALLGCLALMKRKNNGTVTVKEARVVAQSFLENLSVQSLGQYDRKLCFELLECLLCRYPDAVVALGDDLLYRICEAIDSEKDPQCLLITFHIVEVLGRLMPDPSGPVANYAGELFELLGCYFPIHFTHPKGEELDVKRDELSGALMSAFASTPFFEPFAIPLLLDKLSSSLPSAKVEALKYLSHCSTTYGADRMSKHVKALWTSLKDAILNLVQPSSTLESEQWGSFASQENEITMESLMLLQKLVAQNGDVLLSLIVEDGEMKSIINHVTSLKNYADFSLEHKQELHGVGQILSASAKASTVACNKVFESFFCFLMNSMGLTSLSGDSRPEEGHKNIGQLNYGALYLCIELLFACRYLVVGPEELNIVMVAGDEAWYCLLQSFSCSLVELFFSILRTCRDNDKQNVYVCTGVKGLHILATFPGDFLPVSRSIYENILKRLMSVIAEDSNHTYLWKISLKALAAIGSFIQKRNESDKTHCFMGIVVENLTSLISSDGTPMPLSLKLEAMSEVGATGKDFMLAVAQGLEKAVFDNLSQTLALETFNSTTNSTIELLDCLSNKVLPWFGTVGDLNEVFFHFAMNIWKEIVDGLGSGVQSRKEVRDMGLLRATMVAMKLAVANCSEESQSIITDKAFNVLSSSSFFSLVVSVSTGPTKFGSLELDQRDEWIVSLFASVIMALHPQAHIPNIKATMHVFIAAVLSGHLPAAQALGSILNKLPLKADAVENGLTLGEAIDLTLCTHNSSFNDNGLLKRFCGASHGSENSPNTSTIRPDRLQQSYVITKLAWIGKGLIMRGHEKIKDVTMTLLGFLLANSDVDSLSLKHEQFIDSPEHDNLRVMTSAADAFHILMSDSEDCLNRRYHAVIRPLYKQRYFATMMPILTSSLMKAELSITRFMLYRVFAHIISDTPITAIISEAKKLLPIILDSLSMLSEDIRSKDMVYSILLVLSGIFTDKNGQEAVVENAHLIIGRLTGLVHYPHMMLVRETAIQCLVAMSSLPHARIYPMRLQVLSAILDALDDPKRHVRQEAVRCRQAWASIASRSLHF